MNLKPLNIIWLSPDMSGLGGSEYLCCNFCRLLASEGHKIHLVTKKINPAWKKILQVGKGEIHLVEVLSDDLRDYKAAVLALNNNPVSLMQVMPVEGICAELIRSEKFNFPVCGLEPTDLSNSCWWLPSNLKDSFEKLSGLIVVNQHAKQMAETRFGFKKPVAVVAHTLMNDLYSNSGRHYQKSTFGCISRLSAEKGLEYLLGAMSLLGTTHASATLSVWGDGEDHARLVNLAKMLQISDRVRFYGAFHPFRDSAAISEAATVFIQPSLFEGSPTSLLELASRKVPVISSNTYGGRRVLGDDFPGLFPVADTRALAIMMERSLTDPGFTNELKQQAFQRSETVFSPVNTLNQLNELYFNLCKIHELQNLLH